MSKKPEENIKEILDKMLNALRNFKLPKKLWDKTIFTVRNSKLPKELWDKSVNAIRNFKLPKETWDKIRKAIRDFKFTLVNTTRIIFGVFVFFIMLMLFFSYKVNYSDNSLQADKRIRISPGRPFAQIAEQLENEGIINSAFYFKIAAKLQNKDDKIISRSYIFKPGLNNLEVIEILTNPALNFTIKFTVPEGTNLRQIAKSVENKLNMSSEMFLSETENDSLINSIGLKNKVSNLEGFLFPDTYRIQIDISEKELVELLFNEFIKKVIAPNEDLKDNPEKLLKVITLASIVQGETQMESEMPVIAGVYMNRIAKRMKLEADPTVQYILPGGPKQRLLRSDLKTESPYNTYLHYGLPPGPINNPGLKAINAALNPEKHNYIFFVATGKGGHTFTSTYKEHLKAVEEYRKNVNR
jgi:UPF0755 protein